MSQNNLAALNPVVGHITLLILSVGIAAASARIAPLIFSEQPMTSATAASFLFTIVFGLFYSFGMQRLYEGIRKGFRWQVIVNLGVLTTIIIGSQGLNGALSMLVPIGAVCGFVMWLIIPARF